jgi:hypothetical protein
MSSTISQDVLADKLNITYGTYYTVYTNKIAYRIDTFEIYSYTCGLLDGTVNATGDA